MPRHLVLLIAAFAGCAAPLEEPEVTADLAVETARMVVATRQSIVPTPVSDDCDNCNGTGKIGDGRIVHTCPACGGTGKRK